MKRLIQSLILTSIVLAIFSCQSDPDNPNNPYHCSDLDAYNYNDPSACQYRKDLLNGTWSVSENYDGGSCGTGNDFYNVSISPGNGVKEIRISNFLNWGATITMKAQITNYDSSPNLLLDAGDLYQSGSWWHVDGSGHINSTNNTITMTYYLYQSVSPYCWYDCTATFVKL